MSGPQCCENPPILSSTSGAGHVEKLGGFNTYITGPADSDRAILLVSDVFGYEAPNLRKLADKVASAGYHVVVPDFLYGDPFDYSNIERHLPIWLKDHETDKGVEDAKSVLVALKTRGISTVGAAGFCWGAKVVVGLAKYGYKYIQTAVLLHPSFVTLDCIKAVKVPIAILSAEIDNYSPPELVKLFDEFLKSKSEVESFVKTYPGVAHGWTIRYSIEDEQVVKCAEEAHGDMLDWFAKHLK